MIMQLHTPESVIFKRSATSSAEAQTEAPAAARPASTPYNLPSPSEKLTDGTLPISWPIPYLDNLKAGEETPTAALTKTEPLATGAAPLARLQDDYAQLMRKLHAESAVVRGRAKGDRALYAAHYISTLIAALAFLAIMGIVVLNFFPGWIQN